MALSREEEKELARLLRSTAFPVSREVFEALCGAFVVPVVELAIIGATGTEHEGKILLIHRDDSFYEDVWHIPGSVIRPGETVDGVLKRIAREEIGIELPPYEFVRWFEVMKGKNEDQDPRGQELTVLFKATAHKASPHGAFFSLESVPSNTLGYHKRAIQVTVALR